MTMDGSTEFPLQHYARIVDKKVSDMKFLKKNYSQGHLIELLW